MNTVDDRWLLTDEQRAEQGMGPWTQADDPAHLLLTDSHTSTPKVHSETCYICRDPEFAEMGLPLCRECPECKRLGRGKGHVPADDSTCTICGYNEIEAYIMEMVTREIAVFYEGALEVFR